METIQATSPQIGIALSGGGSRAIAFHLGCLRALHKLGILEQAKLLSTVSGGSVIGGMYVTRTGDFSLFEQDVYSLLAAGLVRPSIQTALSTTEGIRAIASQLYVALVSLGLFATRKISKLFTPILRLFSYPTLRSPQFIPRRTASATTIFQQTLDRIFFKQQQLGTLRSDGPQWVALATELRTGSAFYFSKGGAGSYRIGAVDPTLIRVAQAVAASAAYPLLLPAIDETFVFLQSDASQMSERVTLIDGGIYDNLGLAPLWPDRDREISIGVEKLDTIIACRAGYGARSIGPALFFKARMLAAFTTVHMRAQNATMNRLFDLKKAGLLKCFVLPYLDQDDATLGFRPVDLVCREEVADYPTNFSAMSANWIEKLSKRGEQLTLALIKEHAPQFLPSDWEIVASE